MPRRLRVLRRRLAASAILYFAARRVINGTAREGEPPFERGRLPYLGDAMAFGQDAISMLERTRAKHGDVFTLFLAGERMTFVLNPMDAPAVLKADGLSFSATADEVTERAFGVPTVRDRYPLEQLEELGRSRLKGEHLPDIVASMERELRAQHVATLPDGWREVGLYRLVWERMFKAGTDAVFGRGKADRETAQAFAEFDEAFPLLVSGLPHALARKGAAGLRTLARRLATGGEGPSAWVRARLEIFEGAPDDEVGRMQAAVLWALQANTIPATFWTLAHLLAHDDARARVMDELDRVLGTRGPAVPDLTLTQLDGLTWLDACIRESLRLASGSLVVRRATKDTTLELASGPAFVRSGDRVCLAPYFTHHDPDIFEEPYRYAPERFFVEQGVKQFFKGGERVPVPYMPFGAGRTMCPGRHFATHEIKLFVVTTLLAADVELTTRRLPGYMLTRAGLGIFPPDADVRVKIRAR